MDPRKIISFGNSSYIISLPKSWLNKNDLGKGDFVYCSENINNELVLTSQQKEIKKELRSITISAVKKTSKDLMRELISSYISGYDIIKVQLQSGMKHDNGLRDIIRDFTTLDIIDQNKNMIIVKDFLNMEKISIDELTRRIDLIIRSMIEENKIYNSKINIDKTYRMDIEVNRISFMLFRFIRKSLNDSKLANLFKLTPEDLLSLWLLISHLEKIADEVKRVSKFLKLAKLSKKEFDEFLEVHAAIENEYLATIKSYYNKDKGIAFSVAANKGKIIEICNKFAKNSNNPMMSGLMEKIKGMETYLVYVARSIYERT